jgi:lipopolysaccharide transport system permease protein
MVSLNPLSHLRAFGELVGLLTKHRELTFEMTRRELSERYAGQAFGLLWSLVHPLMIMAIYIFIFTIVFKCKLGGSREFPLDYTSYMLAGIIPWLGFQEALGKSSTAMTANASLVKQVVFPIEVLPVKGVLASMFGQCVCACLLIAYELARFQSPSPMLLLLPGLFFLQAILGVGICFVLSAVGAYFRDLKDFVQIFCQVAIYMMPVFYLPDQVPSVFKPLLYANPFSYMIWCYQDVLYFGRFAHPFAWIVFMAFSMLSLYVGYRVFKKLKPYFGNVL